MAVQAPPLPPPAPDPETEAGVIEDARARQRSHRRTGAVLVIAAIAGGLLAAAIAGGGGDSGTGRPVGGQPAGSAPGAGHANVNGPPGAPSTQPNGNGVASHVCPLAPPNPYLPARSGCVTVARADVSGDGRPDLVLVYSHLSHQYPRWLREGSAPPSLRHDFVADAAFLKIVLAGGGSTSVRIPGAWAATVTAVAHVSGTPGREVLLTIGQISSGASHVAYGLSHGRLVSAGVTLFAGGDSASKSGFDCLPGNPPRLIQRTFELIGPTIYGWWRETNVIYAWHGPTLVQASSRTFKLHGAVPASDIGVGHACITGLR